MVTEIKLTKALIRYNGKYLLLKKSKDAYFPENIGKWECSGGVIGENEEPKETILRETEQETGLKCKIIKELPSLRMTDENYDSHCKIYLFEAPSNKVILSEEHSEHKWLYPKDIKNIQLVLYASLLLEYFNNPDKYLN